MLEIHGSYPSTESLSISRTSIMMWSRLNFWRSLTLSQWDNIVATASVACVGFSYAMIITAGVDSHRRRDHSINSTTGTKSQDSKEQGEGQEPRGC